MRHHHWPWKWLNCMRTGYSMLHWVSWLFEICFDGIGRWALITQFSHAILLDHKQSLHFWYTTASEWHSREQFFILNEAEVVDFKHTATLNLSHISKWIPRSWRSRMNTLICMTSIANTYTQWQSISLVQLLKKSVICTMTAVLPKVQQSSWEHITTLTDNQPHNTFQNFYIHVGHIVRLQRGLS